MAMEDDFYAPLSNVTSEAQDSALISNLWKLILSEPLSIGATVLLALLLIIFATRLLSERPSKKYNDRDARTVWMMPYWVPIIGHAFQFIYDPVKLMREGRDRSAHGIFAVNLGTTTHNIVSDPALVKSVMQQKESAVQFQPIAWATVQRFFGVPKRSKAKYSLIWDEFNSSLGYLMKEPHLSNLLRSTIRNLEENIPKMISFTDSDIDLQPWERWAAASWISDSETEINLMILMRDMLGTASVPALFGRALLDKYPNILHDIYDMDAGMMYLLMGLPPWTPWPPVIKAHRARQRAWEGLDALQVALDAMVDGKYVDPTWGDLDDVSEFIRKRHTLYKENGFGITERGDISLLWAVVVNANLVVYWQLLHILANPGLVERLRAEVAPYAQVSKPASIGNFSEAPKLTISHEGLSTKCPLLKATYFEAMRLSSQPWSIRQIARDVVISGDKRATDSASFALHKGEYITVPHDLHMKDPKYFKDPEKFIPERFLVEKEDGTVSAEIGTVRPYGGGPSMCKGRIFAERECLSLVAGILVFWDIEPANKKAGWVIPKQKKTSAVSLPVHETRVRIKRRKFDWES